MNVSGCNTLAEWRAFHVAHVLCRFEHPRDAALCHSDGLVSHWTADGLFADIIGVRYCKKCRVGIMWLQENQAYMPVEFARDERSVGLGPNIMDTPSP